MVLRHSLKMSEEKSFNIEEHELVPKHIKLTEEEKNKLLDELNISPRQLPMILASDPMAKKLDAKPGDIIKIIRKSPTAKESIYYRVVVHG